MMTEARTYAAAIDALNSLQSNAATIEAIRKSGKTVNELNEPEMTEYLARIGHKREELDEINVIHITGTKGKGSTAAFCDSLLRTVRTKGSEKIGLYTSPHMVAARERIRIDGVPLSEEMFAKYFWEVWERLEQNTERQFSVTPLRPIYFRFMTLLAFHVFISERVAATLLEVGIGGLYDSTNIVSHPVVTGVTPLGLDHTAILGNTIEEIALQKAGIFKEGAPALSTQQGETSLQVLRQYAEKVHASKFEVVPELPAVCVRALGLPGDHQRANASLAVGLVREFVASEKGRKLFPGAVDLFQTDGEQVSDAVAHGLERAFWPGRCQTVPAAVSSGATYFLDGAHTIESIQFCVQWYLKEVLPSKESRVLIFNCTNGRSGMTLLRTVLEELEKTMSKEEAKVFFAQIYFCTNNTFADGGSASGTSRISHRPRLACSRPERPCKHGAAAGAFARLVLAPRPLGAGARSADRVGRRPGQGLGRAEHRACDAGCQAGRWNAERICRRQPAPRWRRHGPPPDAGPARRSPGQCSGVAST